ncbi:MAG: hypothetical protein ABIP33_11120, partial [Pseudolysinimonas sp.]
MVILQQPPAAIRARRLSSLSASRATAPVAVGLFGALFSAVASWIPSPWYDEAATISAATRTLPQLFA